MHKDISPKMAYIESGGPDGYIGHRVDSHIHRGAIPRKKPKSKTEDQRIEEEYNERMLYFQSLQIQKEDKERKKKKLKNEI